MPTTGAVWVCPEVERMTPVGGPIPAEDPPTAVQSSGAVQETPLRLSTWFCGPSSHVDPFQNSVSEAPMSVPAIAPTAAQADAPVHETAVSPPPSALFGLGTICQLDPFHFSM